MYGLGQLGGHLMVDTEPSQSQQMRTKDGRAQWERPILRRLAANDADHTTAVGFEMNPEGHTVPGSS